MAGSVHPPLTLGGGSDQHLPHMGPLLQLKHAKDKARAHQKRGEGAVVPQGIQLAVLLNVLNYSFSLTCSFSSGSTD